MGCHRVKIAIIMQQGQSFHDTENADDYVDCFSNRNPGFSKKSVVVGTLNSHVVSTDLAKRESTEEIMDNAALVVKLKDALLEAYDPEAVILFGSLARGDADEFSDVDLLVVIETEQDVKALGEEWNWSLNWSVQ